MKDRIAAHPGRIRLTPVSGQENVYDMERADEPTQVGTPLNKETLLDDETVEKFKGSEAMTPNNAFNAVYEETRFEIGDTVEGLNLNDDGWLWCDGSELSKDDYPELATLHPYTALVDNEDLPTGGTAPNSGYGSSWIREVNGYIVTFVNSLLCYRPVNGSQWQSVDWINAFKAYANYNNFTPCGIEYDESRNLYLVVAVVAYNSSTSYARLFYMSNLSDSPTIGEFVRFSSSRPATSGGTIYDFGSTPFFKKVGDYYVIQAFNYYNAFSPDPVASTSTLTNWFVFKDTTIPGFSTLYNAVNEVEYWDNRYVINACAYIDSTYYYAVYISERNATLENPNFTVLTNGSTSSSATYRGIAFLESQKIVFATKYSNASSVVIDISSTPVELGTCGRVMDSSTNGTAASGSKTIEGFMYTNKYVLIDDPNIPWQEAVDRKMEQTVATMPEKTILSADIMRTSMATSKTRKGIKFLPTITPADSYRKVKIKAKKFAQEE